MPFFKSKNKLLPLLAALLTLALTNGQSSAAELPDILERVKPSIIGVGTYQPTRRPPSRFLGTGFVAGNGSYIVTNAHVVNLELNTDKNERLVVFSGSGKDIRMHRAKIIKSDQNYDLALLKISQNLPALKLSDRANIREGEIYAFTGFPIGSVLGLYPVTHRGMISSITPAAIPNPSSSTLNAKKIHRLRNPVLTYQLDATAYPGNSGSPLYDTETGDVIGILNQVYIKSTKEDLLSTPSGISYAIPAKYLQKLMQELK